jgi:hypothetical protein
MTAASAAALVAIPGAAHAAAPADDALLATLRAVAPHTTSIADVATAPGGAHLAIRTRARGAGDALAHDELWAAAGDGSAPLPLSRSAGSGAEYVSIGSVDWSADGSTLIYAYANSAIKREGAAHAVRFSGGGAPSDLALGTSTYAPRFTADGRYVTFFQGTTPAVKMSGAMDVASRAVLLPARIDYAAPDGTATQPSWVAPECARSQQPSWAAAVQAERWIEQALAAPDPGCRFGANADDPAVTPTPTPSPTAAPSATPAPAVDVSGAQDAPASITKPVAGTNLVTIAERTPVALGPTVRIRSTAKGLARAIRRGVRVKLDVAGAKDLRAYVIATRPTDEDLLAFAGTSTTTDYTVGRLTIRNPASQTQTISIPLTRAAKASLPRFLKITVTVRIAATDRAGNRTVVERQVALTDF